MTAPVSQHDKFYFPDCAGGLSVFMVDGTYFKVHRFMLERESPIFKSMFSSPSPSEGQDGESNEKPIIIPGVSRSEFEALLNFLYNGAFCCFELFIDSKSKDSEIPPNTSEKQKTKILADLEAARMESIRRKMSDDNPLAIFDLLSISLRFEFERITKIAVGIIDWLDKHSPGFGSWQEVTTDLQAVKRINMASSHDALRHWHLPALLSLVVRAAPLTAEEGRLLGYHRMAIVAAEREKRLSFGYCDMASVPPEFLLSG